MLKSYTNIEIDESSKAVVFPKRKTYEISTLKSTHFHRCKNSIYQKFNRNENKCRYYKDSTWKLSRIYQYNFELPQKIPQLLKVSNIKLYCLSTEFGVFLHIDTTKVSQRSSYRKS